MARSRGGWPCCGGLGSDRIGWVGGLHRRRILTFRGPDRNATDAVSAWAEERIFEANEEVEPLCIPGLRLKVSGLLPAAGF